MAGINVEHVNPFLIAATKVLKEACMVDVKVGKPTLKEIQCTDDTYTIMIGVVGEMQGEVMIALSNRVALDIASKMCMMQLTQMDDLSKSAIAELGNMIMGNAATVLATSGVGIDITPPKLEQGRVVLNGDVKSCMNIPLQYEQDKSVDMYLAVVE